MAETQGFLRAVVRTADGIIPIENARVTIEGDGEIYQLLTDKSGITPTVPLPAPPAGNSTSALQTTPFSTYQITTEKEGYYTQVTEKAPVFAGVVSVQPVLLIGRSEYESESLIPVSDTETVRSDPQALNATRPIL